MKTIGLIGGMSWVSTMDYYRIINEMVQKRLGGASSAEIMMHSVDFAPIEQMQAQGDWDAMGATLADSARKLENAGADCILICTNTMHKVAPAVEAAINVPLIHIADAAAIAIKAAGLSKIALLGTRYTMEKPFMRARLETNGVQVVVPSFAERRLIHSVIYDELVKNVFTDASRTDYVEIIGDLAQRGAEGMLLACTEIPMLVKQTDTQVPLFDTTYEHAKAAVAFAFSADKEPVAPAVQEVSAEETLALTNLPPAKPVVTHEKAASVAEPVAKPQLQPQTPEEIIEEIEALLAEATTPPQGPPLQVIEPTPMIDNSIQDLQNVFGGETDTGYGSAVFIKQLSAETKLEAAAKVVYQAFAAQKFEQFGDNMWANWSEVYRASGGRQNFHRSLINHDDFQVSMQAGMLIENHDDPDAARAAFRTAFADTSISEQRVYFIGDDDAYSGLIVASRRKNGTAIFLNSLMD
ncbi:MAG: aspartate/glutamate racemase family protein [Candidatus Promineifilaceae bacterium]